MTDRATPYRVRWIPESGALAMLGITTPCCISCLAEMGDGEMPHQVDENTGVLIDCCCDHVDELSRAIADGRLTIEAWEAWDDDDRG